jgi:hypothetical protein
VLQTDLTRGKESYSAALNNAKHEQLLLADPLVWARQFARVYGLEPTDLQTARMAKALDAVYAYQESVWTMSTSDAFKPENNQNDWIDLNQLFYLADPSVYFLTAERKIKLRCQRSNQANRILVLSEYLTANNLLL